MKKLKIGDLKAGQIIAENIKDKNGTILIKAGASIRTNMISKLKKEKIDSIKILEKGEKLKVNTEDVGQSFLNGLKKRGVINQEKKDKNPNVKRAFRISGIPAFLFVPKSGMPQMASGALPKATFVNAIDKISTLLILLLLF